MNNNFANGFLCFNIIVALIFILVGIAHAESNQPSVITNPDFHRTGNLAPGPQNNPHAYDYLNHPFHIPVTLCMSDECAVEMVESKNLSITECNAHATQVVGQYVLKWSYDRYLNIQGCVRG